MSYHKRMKALFYFGISVAALLAAGCEMVAYTDDGQMTVTDGTVTSLHTQQGNVVVDLNNGSQTRDIEDP